MSDIKSKKVYSASYVAKHVDRLLAAFEVEGYSEVFVTAGDRVVGKFVPLAPADSTEITAYKRGRSGKKAISATDWTDAEWQEFLANNPNVSQFPAGTVIPADRVPASVRARVAHSSPAPPPLPPPAHAPRPTVDELRSYMQCTFGDKFDEEQFQQALVQRGYKLPGG